MPFISCKIWQDRERVIHESRRMIARPEWAAIRRQAVGCWQGTVAGLDVPLADVLSDERETCL